MPNRVALVTGASRGIGRAIAVALATAGCDVMINYVSNQAAAEDAKAEVQAAAPNIRVSLCQADISTLADHEKLLNAVRDEFGRLDYLVNNAGVASNKRVDLLDATPESFDRLISINLRGPYFLSQAVARWMIEQSKTYQSGDRAPHSQEAYKPAIINITSVSAFAASPERGDYCVSKAGLAMMTQLYAVRLANEGVNVYEIRPGVITTDMTVNVKDKYDQMIDAGLTPIRRWGTPEDVGRAVAAIVSGGLPFSTGEVINVDGGFHITRL